MREKNQENNDAVRADELEIIDFLSSPDAFSDGTEKVEIIRTHAAIVFLGKTIVYKIKQPVKYDYMDFSTLEKRATICKKELEINRPNAPTLYLGLASITREKDKTLKLNGRGEVVEWAIKMRRFPEEDILHSIAENSKLDADLASKLGQHIANYHLRLSGEQNQEGAARIFEVIDALVKNLTDLSENFGCGQTDISV